MNNPAASGRGIKNIIKSEDLTLVFSRLVILAAETGYREKI